MPVTEDIRPTQRTLEGTGDNESVTLMYDGDVATDGRIGGDTTLKYRTVYLFDFPAGTVHPDTRTEVYLRVLGMWLSFDSADGTWLYYRPAGAGAWTELDVSHPEVGWAANKTSPIWRQWDITALALAFAATGFQVALTFFNGPGPNPPIPAE